MCILSYMACSFHYAHITVGYSGPEWLWQLTGLLNTLLHCFPFFLMLCKTKANVPCMSSVLRKELFTRLHLPTSFCYVICWPFPHVCRLDSWSHMTHVPISWTDDSIGHVWIFIRIIKYSIRSTYHSNIIKFLEYFLLICTVIPPVKQAPPDACIDLL